MKKLLPLIIFALVGCATKPKEDIIKPQDKIEEQKLEREKLDSLESQVLFYQNNEKLLNDERNAWDKYKLMVVALDKSKKPSGSKSIVFGDLDNSLPYGKMGPKINIKSFETSDSKGKILQLSCYNLDIKQKFDTALMLKGWALDIICGKNNYFIMINKIDIVF